MTTSDKITKGIIGLLLDNCFFGLLARRLKRVADPTIKTMMTNGRVLRYSPKFVDELSLDTLKGCLCHEVLHIALDSHRRRGNRDPEKWNVATDFAINAILKKVPGLGLPAGALYSPAYENMPAEQIYASLPDSSTGGTGNQQGKGGQQGGQGQPGKPGNQPGSSQGPSSMSNGQGQGQPGPGSPGASTGSPTGNGNDCPDPGGCGGVFDAEDDTPAARANERVALAQAYTQAKSRGLLPGCIEQLVEPILHPAVDMKTLLADFVDRSAKSDYSWRRPNSRYTHLGVILPSLYSEKLKLVVGIDTSGSISDEVLQHFGSILREVLSSYSQVEVDAVYCDAHVQRVDHHESGDPEFSNPNVGRGGTKFEPVFDWIAEQGEDPTCLVYLR